MIRWTKVIRDLWNNRARTVLVILSIAVGVFAVGMIAASREALTASLNQQYAAIHPADAILLTEPALNEEFVESIRHIRGVQAVEGRRSLALRLSLDGGGATWRDLTLYALEDYDDQQLLFVRPQDGVWPPEKGQVLLERSSMSYLGLSQGDEILVKTPDGRQFRLVVTGRAHDLYRVPPVIEGWVFGYVSMDTLRWMGESEAYNEVYIRAEASHLVRSLADKAADRIEGLGLPVYQKTLPNAGEHPLNYIITTILLLLSLIAAMSMGLSALLVINVISALIAQQERQIGIMKAIGARSGQVIAMYFALVGILGVAACLIAVPFSFLGARALSSFVAEMINFDPPVVHFTAQGLLLQLGVGLIIPLIAATPAIINGTQVSPARVLSEYGISQVWSGSGSLDQALSRLPRMTRGTLLALRNPFRKRGRLILSLITLVFAGAVFMAIINLQTSLNDALNEMFAFWQYDAWLIVEGHVPVERLIAEAKTIPGVVEAEGWGFTLGRYVRPDGTESDNLYLLAPPAETRLIDPPIIAGRGLLPGDDKAILVSPGLLANEPSLQLGSPMNVKIEGREETYTIVGIVNMMGNSTIGYFSIMDYAAYARHVREPNRANAVILTLAPRSLLEQRTVTSSVEKRYDQADIEVISTFLISEEREEINAAFGIIVALLMVMTIVLASVGGLGLAGTMSLNVIERTREIGVMRAYGASSAAVFRIVIIEGLLIGLMSWTLSIGLSYPLGALLGRNIGLSFMDYPLPPVIAPIGIVAWAILVVIISIVASVFPTLRAVRLTVTEILAYE